MTNDKFCVLIDRLIHGDMSALDIVFKDYFQSIRYTAYCITKDDSDAYDIAVNVLLKLIEYPSDPYAIKNHKGLLISMTKHEALNFMRKKLFSAPFDESAEKSAIYSDEHNLWLYDILSELTDDEKDVLIGHCIWGKSLKSISKEKGVSYRTIARIYASVKGKIKR